MAHKTLIGGTAYEISGGKTLVGGTAYSIAKGRTLVGGAGYEIPFGLQPGPVNYVETTGANCFDTGFYPAVQCYFRVVLDCEFVGGQPGSYPMAFGAWPSAGQSMFAWGVTSNMATWYMYNNRTTKTASVSASGRIILDANNQTGNWTVNGATVASFGPQVVYTQRSILLGAARNSYAADFFSKIRIFSCQMSYATSTSSGFTVGRNYVPHMDTSGKGYLYDTITGAALYPSGTGDALVG